MPNHRDPDRRDNKQRDNKQQYNGHQDDDELERWRQAAEDALQQLDWCIGYLHGIRKNSEAKILARNRAVIRTHILNRPAEHEPV